MSATSGEQHEVEQEGVGRYLIGPRLGAGGMAAVHLAMVKGDLGFSRVVAIKRIHPALAIDRSLVEAIRDEARIAARIRHPNVVAVVDVLASDEDVQIVLEYVHGESGASLLRSANARREPLSVGVAVAIAADALRGLQAAHDAESEDGRPLDVVHRDVSPHNIMVGADGVARVLDFGIAKAHNRAAVTQDGALKGKLAYMAPEQLGGEVDAKSDQYALGLVLWEMLVGRSPFAGASSHGETLAGVIRGVSEKPSLHRPEVPPALDAVVMRALEASPGERFESARAMAEALERCGVFGSRSDVSATVQSLAGAVLEQRASLIARLERTPSASTAPAAAAEPGDPSPLARTETSSSVRVRRRAIVPGIAAAALLVAGSAVLWQVARLRPDPSGGEHLERVPERAADASPEPVASAAASAAVATPPPPLQAVAASAASARTPPDARTGRHHPPAARSTSAGDCSPPYTVDANGFRQYRRECFQR